MKISIYWFLISTSSLILQAKSNPIDLSPNSLFGSLKNVTLGATSFISDSIQKQTEIILQAKETATEYVTNAVAVPKKMLINAGNATKNYIDNTASRGMEIKIKSLMEIFRVNMRFGIPYLDLPILEPLKIEHMDFMIDNKEIGNISSSVDNVVIYNLSTFVVDHVKVSLIEGLSIAMNLSVPTIQADGLYKISGTMGKKFPINGQGPFNLEVRGMKVYVRTVLGYSSGTAYVKNLNLDFSIQSLSSFFHHLYPDESVDETVNQVIAEMAPEIIEVIKPEMKPKLEEIITQRINATVDRLTMGNILGILTGAADIHSFSHLTTEQLTL